MAILKRQYNGVRKGWNQISGIASSPDKPNSNYIDQVRRSIHSILEQEVELCIPLAENSKVTHHTDKYIEDASRIVNIRATEGQRATHAVNELVAPTSYIAIQNILNARAKDQA